MINVVLFFLYSFLFSFLIYKWKFCQDKEIKSFVFPLLFGVKLFFGLLFYVVYTYYYTDRYTSDMYKYFDDSKPLFDCLIQDPRTFFQIVFSDRSGSSNAMPYMQQMNHWQLGHHRQFENSHQLIILFNVLCRFFSFGNILPHFVFINFLSFLGLICLWKSFNLFFTNKKPLFLLSVFLIPSVLFWCSGLLKESLIIFALGFSLYSFFLFLRRDKNKLIHFTFFLLFYFLLFKIKSYMAVSFLPLVLIGIALWISKFRFVIPIFVIGILAVIIMGFGIQSIFPSINPTRALNDKIEGFKEVMTAANPASKFDIGSNEDMDSETLLKLIPKSVAVCLFRPFPWEAKNPFTILVVLENFIFWTGLLICLFFFFRHEQYKRLGPQQTFLLLSIISSASILCFIIGISSFNFGALVRYKAPILIFLFSLPIMLISDKIVEKLNNLKILGILLNKRQ